MTPAPSGATGDDGLPRSSEPVDAWIGLGANLGERRATLDASVDAIAALADTRLVARSSTYESAPVDAAGGDYLNAVVHVLTRLAPDALLRALQAIEDAHLRERPHPNAPRTLDLDLLLFGDATIATDTLIVPHPRLHLRAFVLAPLAEISPRAIVPGRGPVEALLPAVRTQRIAKLDP